MSSATSSSTCRRSRAAVSPGTTGMATTTRPGRRRRASRLPPLLAALDHGADGVLRAHGMADLARDDQVERQAQGLRDLRAQHHAAARQGVDDAVLIAVMLQRQCEFFPGVGAVSEAHERSSTVLSVIFGAAPPGFFDMYQSRGRRAARGRAACG